MNAVSRDVHWDGQIWNPSKAPWSNCSYLCQGQYIFLLLISCDSYQTSLILDLDGHFLFSIAPHCFCVTSYMGTIHPDSTAVRSLFKRFGNQNISKYLKVNQNISRYINARSLLCDFIEGNHSSGEHRSAVTTEYLLTRVSIHGLGAR